MLYLCPAAGYERFTGGKGGKASKGGGGGNAWTDDPFPIDAMSLDVDPMDEVDISLNFAL